jgi:hypothetical protein
MLPPIWFQLTKQVRTLGALSLPFECRKAIPPGNQQFPYVHSADRAVDGTDTLVSQILGHDWYLAAK